MAYRRIPSFAKAAAVRRLFSPVSTSKPATFLQGEERAGRSICRLWSGRSELGISGQVASSGRKFQSLKTILRICAAPDAQFCGPSSIGGLALTASYNRPCRAVYFKRAFCKPMLPIWNSAQTYASNPRHTRKSKPLKNRATPCKPMPQILQTYG